MQWNQQDTLEIAVGAAGAVDANSTGEGDVRASAAAEIPNSYPVQNMTHLCGLLISATTAMPEAVRTGLVVKYLRQD